MTRLRPYLRFAIAFCLMMGVSRADDPATLQITVTNQEKRISLPLRAGVDEFKMWYAPRLGVPFGPAPATGRISAYTYSDLDPAALGFYRLEMVPKSGESILNANVLNRVAYGPSPDDLERLANLGADAYLAEQLSPEQIQEELNFDKVIDRSEWQFVTMTGGGLSSDFYIYLTTTGDCYIDDIKLVTGKTPGAGVNLIKNGDFETTLTGTWTVSTNLSDSAIVTNEQHSGASSLHLVANLPGETRGSSVWQTVSGVSATQIYTLSYWYKPGTNVLTGLTTRFSGNGISVSPDSLGTKLTNTLGNIDDLRAWHVLHAVRSKKQLLEVLLQFLDNHFVTQYSKTRDYFDGSYDDPMLGRVAAGTEYRELQKWRAALLNPACTFYDLLKISAESPAMIIYLDTVNSKGNGSNIANENYARELLELFTFGVDNGYDQNDITVLSRAWTGWSVEILPVDQANNPFAARSTNQISNVGTNRPATSNLFGIWSFKYKDGNHNTNAKTIFPNKTVPARFGSLYAGKSYQLVLPARNGTNGIKDGYEVIAHLANQPFTQEFISVKLCRLFVHDDFATGYDFTDPTLSPEGQLVRQCMNAWETSGGRIRSVLATIFNSDLFRTQAATAQKVKTPMEFVVSAIRALRTDNGDGTFTADTDGYGFKAPMGRMGSMSLFDRAEPDGYPEAAPPWISAGTLAERLRFVQTTCMNLTETGRADGIANGNRNFADPVALLKKKTPSTTWNNAGAVADFFLALVFPGEGKANLDAYRTVAIDFLNTGDDGKAASPLTGVPSTGTSYDNRIRGLVALLLTSQRFQEQ
jgi:uncharacterized protein (DUF1800 family)